MMSKSAEGKRRRWKRGVAMSKGGNKKRSRDRRRRSRSNYGKLLLRLSVGKVRFGSVFCPFFGTGNRTARFGSGFFGTGTEPRPNRSMSVRFGFRAVQTVRNRVFSEP